jgi:hypothetical protein
MTRNKSIAYHPSIKIALSIPPNQNISIEPHKSKPADD